VWRPTRYLLEVASLSKWGLERNTGIGILILGDINPGRNNDINRRV